MARIDTAKADHCRALDSDEATDKQSIHSFSNQLNRPVVGHLLIHGLDDRNTGLVQPPNVGM